MSLVFHYNQKLRLDNEAVRVQNRSMYRDIKIFSLNFFLMLAVSLVSSVSFAKKKEVLRIAVYEHLQTLAKDVGFRDFVVKALEKEDIQLEFYPVPILRAAEMVQDGKLDGQLPSGKDVKKYFPNIIFIEPPLLVSKLMVVYLKSNNEFDINMLSKMQGSIILNHVAADEFAKEKKLQIIEANDPFQALELLEKKRIDYILISDIVFENILRRYPQKKNLLQVDPKPLIEVPYYFSLNRKKEYLIPKIQKALRQAIREDLENYPHIKNIINKNF